MRTTLPALLSLACLLVAQQLPPGGQKGAQKGPLPGGPRPIFQGPVVRIPSTVGGKEGLVVRVSPPAKTRFAEGAPVVVHVPGGFSRGDIMSSPGRLSDFGMVDVLFLFPEGEGPAGEGKIEKSGGKWDWRGRDCMRALADVLAFASGQVKSTEGKSIQDYTGGIAVLTKEVGVIGWSLGGTTVAGALGLFGKSLPNVKWYASFESPYGEGVINGEFGTRGQSNKFYNAKTQILDTSTLRYAPEIPIAFMRRPVPGAEDVKGSLYLDGNGNGKFDEDADVLLSGIVVTPGPPFSYYSPLLTRAAEKQKVFGDKWPAHIGTLKQTTEFTALRDGVSHIKTIVKSMPQLAVIVYAGEEDHVQQTADHRHILLQHNGFLDAGVRWGRLNPDINYVEMVSARRPPRAVQNPAGKRFSPENIIAATLQSPRDGGPPSSEAVSAAAIELADRTRANVWTLTLDRVLFPDAPKVPPRRPPDGAKKGPPR